MSAVAVCVKEIDRNNECTKRDFGGAQKRAIEEMRYCGACVCCTVLAGAYCTQIYVYMRFVLLHFRPFCSNVHRTYSNLFTKICFSPLFFGFHIAIRSFCTDTHARKGAAQTEWYYGVCYAARKSIRVFVYICSMLIGITAAAAVVVVAVVADCVCVFTKNAPYSYGPNTVCILQFSPNSCVITTHILRVMMIIRRKLASRR